MSDILRDLDDKTAEALLTSLSINARGAPPAVEDIGPEFAAALGQAFGVSPTADMPTKGAVARSALAVLADGPGKREAVDAALVECLRPDLDRRFKYGGATSTVPMAILAIVALKTRVRIERDAKGKWSFLFELRDTTLLKPLVQKLVDLLFHARP